MEERGIKAVNLEDNLDDDMRALFKNFKDGLPINYINNEIYPFLLDKFLKLEKKPDLIVGDICTTCSMMLARKFNIPLAVNYPILYDEGTFLMSMIAP